MNWFIRSILFFVFMPLSYYFVLPNVVFGDLGPVNVKISNFSHF